MSYYLIKFYKAEITASSSSKKLPELLFKFEDHITNHSRLSHAFQNAKKIYELRYKKELSQEEKELISENSLILNNLFDINYYGYDSEYIECDDGYIYYRANSFGLLLGGIEGHFLQELYNEYHC